MEKWGFPRQNWGSGRYLNPRGADWPRGASAAGGTLGVAPLLLRTRVVGGAVFILQDDDSSGKQKNSLKFSNYASAAKHADML